MIRDFAKQKLLNLLQSRVGDLFEDFDTQDLELGLWDGVLVLRNIYFKKDALAKLAGLSHLEIVRGHVNMLKVVVPWSSLGSKPVEVSIDGLDIHIETLEELDSMKSASKPRVESKQNSNRDLSKLVAKVLRSVELSIQNINISCQTSVPHHRKQKLRVANPLALASPRRLTSQEAIKSSSCTLECRLDSIKFFTCNTNGEPLKETDFEHPVQSPEGIPVFFHKKLTFTGLELSVVHIELDADESDKQANAVQNTTYHHREKHHRTNTHAHSSPILSPVDLHASFAMLEEDDGRRPSWISLDVASSTPLEIKLDPERVRVCDRIVEIFMNPPSRIQESQGGTGTSPYTQRDAGLEFSALSMFAFRPKTSPTESPRLWWNYALRRISLGQQSNSRKTPFDWFQVTATLMRRHRYIEEYKRQLLYTQLPDHSENTKVIASSFETDRYMHSLESTMSLAHITMYREIAKAQVIAEQGNTRNIVTGTVSSPIRSLSNEEKLQIILDTLAQRALLVESSHEPGKMEARSHSTSAAASDLRQRADSLSQASNTESSDDQTVWAINCVIPSLSVLLTHTPGSRHDFGAGSIHSRQIAKTLGELVPVSLSSTLSVKFGAEVLGNTSSWQLEVSDASVVNRRDDNKELLHVADIVLKYLREPIANSDIHQTVDVECRQVVDVNLSDGVTGGIIELFAEYADCLDYERSRMNVNYSFKQDCSTPVTFRAQVGSCELQDETVDTTASVCDWTLLVADIQVCVNVDGIETNLLSCHSPAASEEVNATESKGHEKERVDLNSNAAHKRNEAFKLVSRHIDEGDSYQDQLRVSTQYVTIDWNPSIICMLAKAVWCVQDAIELVFDSSVEPVDRLSSLASKGEPQNESIIDDETVEPRQRNVVDETHGRRSISITFGELKVKFYRNAQVFALTAGKLTVAICHGSVSGHAAIVELNSMWPLGTANCPPSPHVTLLKSISTVTAKPALVFVYNNGIAQSDTSSLTIQFLCSPIVNYSHQTWLYLKDFVMHGIVGLIQRLIARCVDDKSLEKVSPTHSLQEGMSCLIEFHNVRLMLETRDCVMEIENQVDDVKVSACSSSVVVRNPWCQIGIVQNKQHCWNITATNLTLESDSDESQTSTSKWTAHPVNLEFNVYRTDNSGLRMNVDGIIRQGLELSLTIDQYVAFRQILSRNIAGQTVPVSDTKEDCPFEYHQPKPVGAATAITIDFGDAVLCFITQELNMRFQLPKAVLSIRDGEIRFSSCQVVVSQIINDLSSTVVPTVHPIIHSISETKSTFQLVHYSNGLTTLSFQYVAVNACVDTIMSTVRFILNSGPATTQECDVPRISVAPWRVTLKFDSCPVMYPLVLQSTEGKGGFQSSLYVPDASVTVLGQGSHGPHAQTWTIKLIGKHSLRLNAKNDFQLNSETIANSDVREMLHPIHLLETGELLEVVYSLGTFPTVSIHAHGLLRLWCPVRSVLDVLNESRATTNALHARNVVEESGDHISSRELTVQSDVQVDKPQAIDVQVDKPQAVDVQVDKPQAVDVQVDKPQAIDVQVDKPQAIDVQDDKPQGINIHFTASDGILAKIGTNHDRFSQVLVSAGTVQVKFGDRGKMVSVDVYEVTGSIGNSLKGTYKDVLAASLIRVALTHSSDFERKVSIFWGDSSQFFLSQDSVMNCLQFANHVIEIVNTDPHDGVPFSPTRNGKASAGDEHQVSVARNGHENSGTGNGHVPRATNGKLETGTRNGDTAIQTCCNGNGAQNSPPNDEAIVPKLINCTGLDIDVVTVGVNRATNQPTQVLFYVHGIEGKDPWQYTISIENNQRIPGSDILHPQQPNGPTLFAHVTLGCNQELQVELRSEIVFENQLPVSIDVQLCTPGQPQDTKMNVQLGDEWPCPVLPILQDEGAIQFRLKTSSLDSGNLSAWGTLTTMFPVDVVGWALNQGSNNEPWVQTAHLGVEPRQDCDLCEKHCCSKHSMRILIECARDSLFDPIRIKFGPTSTATNTLPFDLHLCIGNGKEYLLPSGSHTALMGGDTPIPRCGSMAKDNKLKLKVRCGYGNFSSPAIIALGTESKAQLMLVDNQGHRSRVTVEVSSNIHNNTQTGMLGFARALWSTIRLVFFAPTCVLNRSHLPLAYYLGEWFEPHSLTGASDCVLLDLCDDPSMRLRLGPESRSEPSLKFPIDVPGASGPVIVPTNRGEGVLLGVSITQGTGEFHRTRYITVGPRVIIGNKTTAPIRIRLGTGRMSQLAAGQGGHVMVVSPGQIEPVLVPTAASSAQLKLVLSRSSCAECHCECCEKSPETVLGVLDVEQLARNEMVLNQPLECILPKVQLASAVVEDGAVVSMTLQPLQNHVGVESCAKPVSTTIEVKTEDVTMDYEFGTSGPLAGVTVSATFEDLQVEGHIPKPQITQASLRLLQIQCTVASSANTAHAVVPLLHWSRHYDVEQLATKQPVVSLKVEQVVETCVAEYPPTVAVVKATLPPSSLRVDQGIQVIALGVRDEYLEILSRIGGVSTNKSSRAINKISSRVKGQCVQLSGEDYVDRTVMKHKSLSNWLVKTGYISPIQTRLTFVQDSIAILSSIKNAGANEEPKPIRFKLDSAYISFMEWNRRKLHLSPNRIAAVLTEHYWRELNAQLLGIVGALRIQGISMAGVLHLVRARVWSKLISRFTSGSTDLPVSSSFTFPDVVGLNMSQQIGRKELEQNCTSMLQNKCRSVGTFFRLLRQLEYDWSRHFSESRVGVVGVVNSTCNDVQLNSWLESGTNLMMFSGSNGVINLNKTATSGISDRASLVVSKVCDGTAISPNQTVVVVLVQQRSVADARVRIEIDSNMICTFGWTEVSTKRYCELLSVGEGKNITKRRVFAELVNIDHSCQGGVSGLPQILILH